LGRKVTFLYTEKEEGRPPRDRQLQRLGRALRKREPKKTEILNKKRRLTRKTGGGAVLLFRPEEGAVKVQKGTNTQTNLTTHKKLRGVHNDFEKEGNIS